MAVGIQMVAHGDDQLGRQSPQRAGAAAKFCMHRRPRRTFCNGTHTSMARAKIVHAIDCRPAPGQPQERERLWPAAHERPPFGSIGRSVVPDRDGRKLAARWQIKLKVKTNRRAHVTPRSGQLTRSHRQAGARGAGTPDNQRRAPLMTSWPM
jgi:hypothetical protein